MMLGARSARANRPSRVRARQLVPLGERNEEVGGGGLGVAGSCVADSLTTSGSCGALRTRAAAVDHAGGPLELKDEAAAFSASCGDFLPSRAPWICTWSAWEAAL